MKRDFDPADTVVGPAETGVATASGPADATGETPADSGRRSRRAPARKRRSSTQDGGARKAGDLVALLSAELDGPTIRVEDGERRSVTKRELIAAQLVDRSAKADLSATKLLVDLLGKIQQPPGAAESAALDAADEKVIATVLARLGMAE